MAERTKDDLIADADAAGIDTEGKTKADLEGALEASAPPELGPVIPEGQTAPEPKATGRPRVGVQPVEVSDIPDAGR